MDDDVVLEALYEVAECAASTITMQKLRSGRRSMDTVSFPVRNLRVALDHLDALQKK